MGTVTQIVGSTKQPRGGFLPIDMLETTKYDDGRELSRENIKPARMGQLVDYLTRFSYTNLASDAFAVSLAGARAVDQEKKASKLVDTIQTRGIKSESSVAAAYDLTGYDVAYRAAPQLYSGPGADIDDETIVNALVMVSRARKIMGDMEMSGVFFPYSVFNNVVTNGDADFLSKDDTLYDMKVSKYGVTPKDTLQLMMYGVLLGEDSGVPENIGIVNPRLNTVSKINWRDIPKEAIDNARRLMGFDY